ncbi:MAG: LapD/MoxY N-terminal periplasmic domain-containing protein [Paracoccus sp. (in: a-proteobacteria)]|uniref:LapD/MoxY N-terminal periplasmic domain-containing protein n=1 Tax=Paracoccus sp. TaxID=267 RepID=UPI0026DF6A70|nr:LapD/MoxY N-terminal periplasmic domain-containing protein [Paracoccus sp. (in: a-proteobacteria)]MDO5622735.1 LapD/MoxY N-terminal periplasmic domain-containing protein [Paracoccus sp. (in: a-proteobacteria)]
MRRETGSLFDTTVPKSRRLWSLHRIVTVVPLAAGIVLGATIVVIIILNARIAIDEETASAFRTAQATVAVRMPPSFARADTMGDAMQLAHEINALRHVSAHVVDNKGTPLLNPSTPVSMEDEAAPGWFTWLMRPEVKADSFTISHYPNVLGSLVVETDPADEITEVWKDFRIIMPLLALTCIALIGMSMGFSNLILRRLHRVQDALGAMRHGDLDRRAPPERLAEFASLASDVNALAIHLKSQQAENEHLQTRLLTLSETERARIASDLHDDMGPQLFALNAALSQALAAARDVSGKGAAQLDDALRAISTHANAVRDSARSAIDDLRPMLMDCGSLQELLGELVAEFTEIAPEITIDLDCTHQAVADELAETAIYRFVRESLLNAVRHGKARRIRIKIHPTQDLIVTQVRDDGRGPAGRLPSRGHGLTGIRDRARAMGASFDPPRRVGAETVTELRMPAR